MSVVDRSLISIIKEAISRVEAKFISRRKCTIYIDHPNALHLYLCAYLIFLCKILMLSAYTRYFGAL